jgi:phytoene synthase
VKSFELNQNSKDSLSQGSKSFSLASRFFSKELQEDVAHLYSWCRWCDDVADGSVLGFDQNPKGLPKNRVQLLLAKSYQAFSGNNSDLELPFIAFGQVMRKYHVPWLYAEDLLKGMQHDVSGKSFETLEDLLLYCYRVAGTVGLMMCHIMGLKNSQSLEKAVHLGIALQLTNIVRDMGDDFRVSKVYLPQTWLSEFKISSNKLLDAQYSMELESLAKKLFHEADRFYQSGLTGLKDLPWRCALAVAIAASVYRKIGKRVMDQGHLAWNTSGQTRVSLSPWDQIQACCVGVCLFLKTIPSRMIDRRPALPIEQIWRYS